MIATWIIAALAVLAAPAWQDDAVPERSVQVRTVDEVAAGRCLNGLVGIRGVQMRCVVDAQGRPSDCEILNPSPAITRRASVFRCMASKMQATYEDGTPAEGQTVFLNLGGRTYLSSEELRRDREAERAGQ
ncbi:hypothetical protein [Brevundimonas lenta]|uniref:DUF4333 domain-containing protein n=1 Tax=Brevundimonas lenta TaxID=424796 RepID=A0A7W6NR59_9CAUL|nr:hypothetical protein [Brevundimonas lenta]MBB4083825.1 hypothetical protein [Brevundimonas lenta]